MKCKYCCEHLYAQTEADLENHFRSEHKTVKNFSKHLDFLCRICMQCETHDTWNDLKQHLEDVHRDLFVTNDEESDMRKEEKELSPDVSPLSDIVRPLIESLIENIPSN
jgi:hypothetical protein